MKILKKLKTKVTLYFDYDYESVDTDHPRNMRGYDVQCGEDYDYLRKGSILKVYSAKEFYSQYTYFNVDFDLTDDAVVCVSNNKRVCIPYDSIEDIMLNDRSWYEEVAK